MAAYRGLFKTQSKNNNEAFFANIFNDFKLLTIFSKKKLHWRGSTGLKKDFLASS